MGKPGATGLTRVKDSFFYSLAGLRAAFREEAAFRQECALALVMVPVAFWLGQTAAEISLLIASVLLVLIIELINSAMEAIVDRVGTGHHELSGRAKDIGSAAVFVSMLLTATVWILIAAERFL